MDLKSAYVYAIIKIVKLQLHSLKHRLNFLAKEKFISSHNSYMQYKTNIHKPFKK